MDIHPAAKGHTLVISKKHFENIFDIPDSVLVKVIKSVKKTAKNIKLEMKVDGINIRNASGLAAGQEVSHFHIHLIPRYKNDKLKFDI